MLAILTGNKSHLLLIGNQISSLISGVILLWGTYLYIERKMPKIWIVVSIIAVIWIAVSISFKLDFILMSIPTFFFLAIINIYTGFMFIMAKKESKNERIFTGASFILWGIHKADYPFLRTVTWFAPWGYLIGAFLEFTVAIGVVLLYFQRSKMQIKESNLLMHTVIETIPDLVWLKDTSGVYLSCNPKVERFFGAKENEIVGKTDYDFVDKKIANLFRNKDKEVMAAGILSMNEETVVYADDGHSELLEIIKTPVYDAKGVIAGILGIARNITERKQAEKALYDSHKRFLTVLDSIDATVYVADMKTYEILFMNKHMVDSFGGDMTGEICWKTFREKSGPCSFCTNDLLIDENKKPTGVQTWQDKNPVTGKWYINHDRAIEWTDGHLVRLQIATDITEFKNLESKLQQSQKMESIGTLAGGIAHDFNNLLYPIIGFAEMLKEDLPQDSPEHGMAQEVFNAGKRGGELVKQILAFSRQSDHKLSPVRFQKILAEVLKLTRSTIPSDIQMHQDIQKDCGLIMAEETQLHQIAMNLITNAYHAVEKTSGEISIQLKEIMLDNDDLKDSPLQPGQYVMLSVSDNGVGIPRGIMNNIFEPYFTTKEKGKGTGLGLAAVYGILTEHKGDIKVYSEEGKGTTFNVYLPLMKKSTEAVSIEKALNKLTGTERILLVDDEESVVRLEKQMLERLGYNVSARSDSLEALETFNSNPDGYDLVISDMTMPNMTGDQLAQELMSIRADIPIIICTGFSERINKEQAEANKVKGFLMKPVVKSEMAQMVRKVLDEAKSS